MTKIREIKDLIKPDFGSPLFGDGVNGGGSIGGDEVDSTGEWNLQSVGPIYVPLTDGRVAVVEGGNVIDYQ